MNNNSSWIIIINHHELTKKITSSPSSTPHFTRRSRRLQGTSLGPSPGRAQLLHLQPGSRLAQPRHGADQEAVAAAFVASRGRDPPDRPGVFFGRNDHEIIEKMMGKMGKWWETHDKPSFLGDFPIFPTFLRQTCQKFVDVPFEGDGMLLLCWGLWYVYSSYLVLCHFLGVFSFPVAELRWTTGSGVEG